MPGRRGKRRRQKTGAACDDHTKHNGGQDQNANIVETGARLPEVGKARLHALMVGRGSLKHEHQPREPWKRTPYSPGRMTLHSVIPPTGLSADNALGLQLDQGQADSRPTGVEPLGKLPLRGELAVRPNLPGTDHFLNPQDDLFR